MTDADCVNFLQWALPELRMRWPGFRRVRKQVCKRLKRRIQTLGLDEIEAYRRYLDTHPDEWRELDRLCQVTVSRFYRDKLVFASLEQQVLPSLARHAVARDDTTLRFWSAGCSSGEEPYTLALLWKHRLAMQFPQVDLHILATDINSQLLLRAERASYSFSAVKNLPLAWRDVGFTLEAGQYCLRPEYRRGVEFMQHDIRSTPPAGPFDLILCRNLVLTYFNTELQCEVMTGLKHVLAPHGFLVIGVHEHLPRELVAFKPYAERLGIYTFDSNTNE